MWAGGEGGGHFCFIRERGAINDKVPCVIPKPKKLI